MSITTEKSTSSNRTLYPTVRCNNCNHTVPVLLAVLLDDVDLQGIIKKLNIYNNGVTGKSLLHDDAEEQIKNLRIRIQKKQTTHICSMCHSFFSEFRTEYCDLNEREEDAAKEVYHKICSRE